MADLNEGIEITLPVDAIDTEQHRFRIEEFVANIDPFPFSIAPLPDGGFLLTEKTRGVSIISPEGEQSALIEGTPDGLR